jgi:hypothetical protein
MFVFACIINNITIFDSECVSEPLLSWENIVGWSQKYSNIKHGCKRSCKVASYIVILPLLRTRSFFSSIMSSSFSVHSSNNSLTAKQEHPFVKTSAIYYIYFSPHNTLLKMFMCSLQEWARRASLVPWLSNVVFQHDTGNVVTDIYG